MTSRNGQKRTVIARELGAEALLLPEYVTYVVHSWQKPFSHLGLYQSGNIHL